MRLWVGAAGCEIRGLKTFGGDAPAQAEICRGGVGLRFRVWSGCLAQLSRIECSFSVEGLNLALGFLSV